ncbi:DMT family transporter [Vallitalea okinawensis]|uniref:DMT family transporter n=1 Tax=Vallitalea okinawensis TaxID=2078660 RepID=UPI000CFB2772|nr:DMT family transporter [Vallitalea okinawensis]
MFYFLAFITGIIVIITIILNGNLSNRIGYHQATLINFILGILFAAVLYLLFDWGNTTNLKDIPVYLYFGGAFGVAIVILNSVVVIKISAVYTTVLVFVGQLFAGILIDYLRFKTLEWGDIIGGIIIIGGVCFNLYCDQKSSDQETEKNLKLAK